jgi:hypothetical protein
MAGNTPAKPRRSSRGRQGSTTHGLTTIRRQLARLTTKRLDGRSRVAVAVKAWKGDIRADLGGNLSRAQETLLEVAAQTWVMLSSVDDWLARQPTLVTRKRQLIPALVQRQQLADSLARILEKLGFERKAKPVATLTEYLAEKGPAP